MSAQPHIIEVTAMYRSDLAKAYKKPSTKAFTDWLNRSCNDLELKEELKGKQYFSSRQVNRIYKSVGRPTTLYQEND